VGAAVRARRVTRRYASDSAESLALAERLGARPLQTNFDKPQRRYPIVVDSGMTPAGLRYAIRATEPEGILQSVSFYPGGNVPMPLGRLYTDLTAAQVSLILRPREVPGGHDAVTDGTPRFESVDR